MAKAEAERPVVHGIELEAPRRGSGRPLLVLHGFDTINPDARVHYRACRRRPR